MTTGISTYALKKIQDNWFGAAGNSVPGTFYAALFVAGSEVANSNNYSRVAITNNATNFPPGTSANPSIILNGTLVQFATPSGSWGTPDNVRFFDSGTYGAGNEHAKATIGTPAAIGTNDDVHFAIGALSFSLGS